tara:strand:- start:854 stop:1105 length:252 start_codon:yes stop_codon:yes gene_type:complete
MEERFLEQLSGFFPKMKFSLINMKLPSPIFGCDERQTLKAGRKKIKLSWSPPISKIKYEEYYQRLLNECVGEVEKLYPKRKWF